METPRAAEEGATMRADGCCSSCLTSARAPRRDLDASSAGRSTCARCSPARGRREPDRRRPRRRVVDPAPRPRGARRRPADPTDYVDLGDVLGVPSEWLAGDWSALEHVEHDVGMPPSQSLRS
jgi:hypothetical protein